MNDEELNDEKERRDREKNKEDRQIISICEAYHAIYLNVFNSDYIDEFNSDKDFFTIDMNAFSNNILYFEEFTSSLNEYLPPRLEVKLIKHNVFLDQPLSHEEIKSCYNISSAILEELLRGIQSSTIVREGGISKWFYQSDKAKSMLNDFAKEFNVVLPKHIALVFVEGLRRR